VTPRAVGTARDSAPGLPAATALGQRFVSVGIPAEASVDAGGTPLIDVQPQRWVPAARHARDALGMDFLDWLSAVDEPEGDPAGVDIVLHIVSTSSLGGAAPPRRMLLRTRLPETALALPSLTALWPGVAWHERETFEMFGVDFTDYSDGTGLGLRPLLLPDGFEGTPLRKSFVLAARASKPWPGAKEPGERTAAAGRRRLLPAGVPDAATWGPRTAPAGDGSSGQPAGEDGPGSAGDG
jgi:NADH-quinone oxidoreductase subunit C